MSLNMKALTQAFAKTAAVIEKTVQTTVQEVTGPRALQDYDLLDQVGSGGPGLAWRLFSARPRPSAASTQYSLVCVWLLDKRALSEVRAKAGLSKAAEDSFLDLARADATRLVRLRHPGVVHVVQALDESKTAMAMVTEPLFASVANALGCTDNIAKVPKELKGMEMGLLEVKHGLLQVAESLDFIHNNARLIHRAISPETVFITSSGAWKLGGFGFAVSVEQMSGDINSVQPFHYSEYDVDDSILPLQPSLNYTAPELVRSKSPAVRCSADIFSFGCLTYNLVTKKPLLDCQNNVNMYMNSLTYLSSETFSAVPPDLVIDLQRMLSTDEVSRPSASDFTGSPFFRDDTRLRALRFLDHMLERDNMQKSEFLKALSDMWKDFDSRILRYKVLPPLCAELRNVVMQPMILPMVLTIAESQEKVDFELSTMPALIPVLSSASGETLLLLVKHAELIINKANHELLLTGILPLLVRAYDDTDPRIQEEVLRRTVPLAKQLDLHLVKQAILPRVHSLALRTTVAAVRVNALKCLGDMVSSLDKNAVQDILQTVQRCTAVDRSAPTLMCTLAIANSIFKQHGIEFTAELVLPLLCPLLTAQQLNVQQFVKFMLFVKDILRKIEEKRGISVTESGVSDVRVMASTPNGINSESVQKASTPVRSSSWDEDWGPLNRGPGTTTTTRDSSPPAMPTVQVSQPNSVSLPTSKSSDSVFSQQSKSPTSIDLEWPRCNPSSAFSSQIDSTHEKQNQTSVSSLDGSFDDIDPFANWPPKLGNTGSGIGFGTTPIASVGSSAPPITNFGSMINRNPMGVPMQQQGGTLSMSNLNGSMGLSANSFGGIKNQSDPLSMLGNPNPSMNLAAGKDLGSIFNSTNSSQLPLRLAPPPSTAIGGRGRGRSSGQMRNSPKMSTRQASLMDLL